MSAPDLAALFAGDYAIAEAWSAMLEAAGVSVFEEFSDPTKATPYVEVQIESLAITDKRHNFQDENGRLIQYADQWRAVLVSRVCTQRGKNSGQQKIIVGQIRAAARLYRTAFNSNVIPYHRINSFLEAGVVRTMDEDKLLDKTEVRHALHFGVHENGWAAVAAAMVDVFAFEVVGASYQLESAFRLWNSAQSLAFALSVQFENGLEIIRIANVGVAAATDNGHLALRTIPGAYRFKADGTFQLWNPDQSLFHTIVLRGRSPGDEELHVEPMGEALAVEPADGSYLLREVAGKYRIKADGTFQLWNPDQSLYFAITVTGMNGQEQVHIAEVGEA